MKDLSTLLASIPPSATIAVNDKAKALRASGKDIIVLAGGDPNFDTPPHIVQAGIDALRAGKTHYPSPSRGTIDVLEAIADKMFLDNLVQVDERTDIVVTPGSKWALFTALAAVTNSGDEVIYFEPAWVSYDPMIRLANGVPVPVSLRSESNFEITEQAIRRQLTPKTKAILVNSPCNPTGRVLTRSEVEAIVTIANEADLYVITDEIYEKLIYDGRKHYSLVNEQGMAQRTITTNGLSKAYAMTGWRLGWVAGPTPVMKLVAKIHSQTITSAATFTMAAAAVALKGPQDAVEEMRLAYLERRDFMVKALNEIEGIECALPEGAFYLFPRFTQTEKNSLELADMLLEDVGIAGTPGIAFGQAGEQHLRFSIATEMSELERAVDRLVKAAPNL